MKNIRNRVIQTVLYIGLPWTCRSCVQSSDFRCSLSNRYRDDHFLDSSEHIRNTQRVSSIERAEFYHILSAQPKKPGVPPLWTTRRDRAVPDWPSETPNGRLPSPHAAWQSLERVPPFSEAD